MLLLIFIARMLISVSPTRICRIAVGPAVVKVELGFLNTL